MMQNEEGSTKQMTRHNAFQICRVVENTTAQVLVRDADLEEELLSLTIVIENKKAHGLFNLT